MKRIFYAAGPSIGSYFQLKRFLEVMKPLPYDVRVGAYRSSCQDLPVDYTLDSLDCFYGSDRRQYLQTNIDRLKDEIRIFKPHLIISDLDFYSVNIAKMLRIPCWIVSNGLAPFAAKGMAGKKYLQDNLYNIRKNLNWIELADRKYFYSHLGDATYPFPIKKSYTYVRPYFLKTTEKSESNITAIVPTLNKKVFTYLAELPDLKLFSFNELSLNGINVDILRDKDYSDALSKSSLLFTLGIESHVADAFYNGIKTVAFCYLEDAYIKYNISICKKFGTLSTALIADKYEDIYEISENKVVPFYNRNIRFIHEHIKEYLGT